MSEVEDSGWTIQRNELKRIKPIKQIKFIGIVNIIIPLRVEKSSGILTKWVDQSKIFEPENGEYNFMNFI